MATKPATLKIGISLDALHKRALRYPTAEGFRASFGETRGDPYGIWAALGFKSATDFYQQARRVVLADKEPENLTQYGFVYEE